ncbi:unnamed protein product [Peniophora sp. CBMAI 1063]|nr:unnamed protein product [Peniophora sp. CBMAI 1063]
MQSNLDRDSGSSRASLYMAYNTAATRSFIRDKTALRTPFLGLSGPRLMDDEAHATLFLTLMFINSVIARSFNIGTALERVRRLGLTVHRRTNSTTSLDHFIISSLGNAWMPGLPPRCIALCTYSALPLHDSDQAIPDPFGVGWQLSYSAVDLTSHEPELIVPQHLFTPFEGTKRSESALQRTDMLLLFFTRSDGGVGVRVAADADYEAIPDTPTRVSATSLKVTLRLLNYSLVERQIQLRSPNAKVSARRLARLVAAKVRSCIEHAERENATISHWNDPRWKSGTTGECIKAGDVILIGLIFVSPGKVTPLLSLRSDYNLLGPSGWP